MDISLVIVSIVLVGSVFIPYFMLNGEEHKERKKIGLIIKCVISENNLNISESENWGNRYIGIDKVQRKMLFLKIIPSGNYTQLLDLNTLKGCQILIKRKDIKTKYKKDSILENLDLEVSVKNKEILLLNFFDTDDNIENYELNRIEKWRNNILGYISAKPFSKKAA